MGGGDPFGPGVHINIPGHMTPPTQLISTDPAHHSDISIDQSGPDRTSVSLVPDQSLSSSASSSSHSSSQGDGADSPDVNGNGRQTLLTDSNTAGGAESGTNFHIDLTASGLGLGHDVTESTPVVLHTESVDRFTHTASGGYSHTDLVTMAADSTGADTVSADPTGRPLDSTNPAVTDHTQAAGSACSLQVQSLNSTTHLVRVLKVQKMWNWRIPADFHIKPRVRFLRYRFQCTDQSAWPRKSDPPH
ncbi:uncharacterized protein LOC104931901 [Larimichthys crocea]|uniref:uncharacterized protein LOC104931901 n=1 Tax=Larimichthys crocea TaxID=215358 RepID=UPI000900FF05|nr:uncharacterized protein LOC104931901 [Larimichthys crocea]